MTSEELTAARTSAGLSFDQLARYLGVSSRTIRRWEKEAGAIGKLEELAIQDIFRSIGILKHI